MNLLTRAATPDDEEFLRALILSHIENEIGASFWPEPMRTHLTGMQCDARRQSIRANFPGVPEHVIEIDGHRAGWLVLAESETHLQLVEILIASAWRGKGAGTELLREITRRAAASGKPVRLQVEVRNTSAIRLYERAGFRRTGEDAVRYLMESGDRSTGQSRET
jgi:ribosomal protein S18 acetylase RimI-like enzyme